MEAPIPEPAPVTRAIFLARENIRKKDGVLETNGDAFVELRRTVTRETFQKISDRARICRFFIPSLAPRRLTSRHPNPL